MSEVTTTERRNWRQMMIDENLWDYSLKWVPVPPVREMVEEIEKLRAQVDRLTAPPTQGDDGWLPIESAPKDGRWIVGSVSGANQSAIIKWSSGMWIDVDHGRRFASIWTPIPIPAPRPQQAGEQSGERREGE